MCPGGRGRGGASGRKPGTRLPAVSLPPGAPPPAPPAPWAPPNRLPPPPQPAQQPAAPQPVAPPQDMPQPESRAGESAAYNVGAGIANVFYVPGKGFLCFLGGGPGIFILAVSFGSGPKTPPHLPEEGCGCTRVPN